MSGVRTARCPSGVHIAANPCCAGLTRRRRPCTRPKRCGVLGAAPPGAWTGSPGLIPSHGRPAPPPAPTDCPAVVVVVTRRAAQSYSACRAVVVTVVLLFSSLGSE